MLLLAQNNTSNSLAFSSISVSVRSNKHESKIVVVYLSILLRRSPESEIKLERKLST